MKSNNTYILILGVIIIGIFSYISCESIIGDAVSSNNFYSKTEEQTEAKINSMNIDNGKLVIDTTAKKVCIKTTKSNPKESSVCWQEVKDNIVSSYIYDGKTYYIWIMDNNNNISKSYKYNTNEAS